MPPAEPNPKLAEQILSKVKEKSRFKAKWWYKYILIAIIVVIIGYVVLKPVADEGARVAYVYKGKVTDIQYNSYGTKITLDNSTVFLIHDKIVDEIKLGHKYTFELNSSRNLLRMYEVS